ncbi:AcrR family transcriptional regulator [Sphingobium wenxiniae]|uniref:HTH tetR-type domain-containing protein n=2 Tax=Sphingobium TaxID=165695 RepID=T0G7K4_9SPHN|nr:MULTISPECIES: TetR family transcriptional regulator [Sphingobium]EQA96601.1 hypothetical protein L485_24000 [Sphingobium baderi LL03]KMS64412.1 hypothetical protein V475_12040 [Sphingobium baderi LL03]MBB6190453.1 AcrR family transcriptional regulator [Sphingobium wenxiniae]TWH95170.1 TetR family transcriptional regulator [Sphingobium wenxiniae]WRD78155.1 TetR/AcrR family transcriptional regulator [Sphingobium baderi]
MTVVRPSLRQEQKYLTRRRIAEAARTCFYETGIAETSIEQIARVAGVGRATLYLHFPNKDAILLELLSSNLRGVRGIYQELGEMDAPDAAALRRWLARYVGTLREHRLAMRLFHVGLANDPQARGLVDDHRDAIVDMLAARFPHLGLGPDRDPRAHAHIVLLLARIDHLASAAVEEEPRIDLNAGLDIVAEEMALLLARQ